MIYPDLERELHTDRTAEIERKNRESSAAHECAERAMANRRASDGRKLLPHGRRPRTQRDGRLETAPPLKPLNPKPRTGRPPSDPERLQHWGTALLDYVRRDTEEQRREWLAMR